MRHTNADAITITGSLKVALSQRNKVQVKMKKLTMLHPEMETNLLEFSSCQKCLLQTCTPVPNIIKSSITKTLQVVTQKTKVSRQNTLHKRLDFVDDMSGVKIVCSQSSQITADPNHSEIH
jgi:hypothetical protein